MPAGVPVNLPNFSNFMKVRGLFDDQFRQYSVEKFLLENYEKSTATTKLGGRVMEVPLETRGPASFGAQLEHEHYSEPDAPGAALATLSIATLTSSILLTLQAHLSSKDNRAAWVSAQVKTMNSANEIFGQNHSRVLHGDGSGAVARLIAGGGAIQLNVPVAGQTTLTLEPDQGATSSLTFGTKYMLRGLRLSASASKTGQVAERTADLRVVSVNDAANQIVVDGPVGTLAAQDFLFYGSLSQTSKGRMPVGLFGSVSSTGTYLGINRATAGNEFWRATERTNIGSLDLEIEIQKSMDEVHRLAGGKTAIMLFSLGVWRRFAADLRVDRQFISAAETGKYKGGTKMLMYTGSDMDAAIVRDRDVPTGTITGLDWTTHKMGTLLEAGWLQAFDEKGIWRQIPGTLDYCAILAWMGQPFCVAPIKNWIMRDVAEA